MLPFSAACTWRRAVASPSVNRASPRRSPALHAGVATPGSDATQANGLISCGLSPSSSTDGCPVGSPGRGLRWSPSSSSCVEDNGWSTASSLAPRLAPRFMDAMRTSSRTVVTVGLANSEAPLFVGFTRRVLSQKINPFPPLVWLTILGSTEPSRGPLEPPRPAPRHPSSGMDRYEVATPQACPDSTSHPLTAASSSPKSTRRGAPVWAWVAAMETVYVRGRASTRGFQDIEYVYRASSDSRVGLRVYLETIACSACMSHA